MKQTFLEKFQIIFLPLKGQKSEDPSDEELYSNGIWKIESPDIFEGGELYWNKTYLIRHLVSGQYLSIDRYYSKQEDKGDT